MDSLAFGHRVLPIMQELPTRLSKLDCAVLCTADGFNVCSLGVSEDQLGRMAALTSSLLSVAEATLDCISGSTQASAPVVTMERGNTTLVGIQVGGTRLPLLLLLAVRETPLGVILLTIQRSAERIRELLKAS
jgi:predicted regulator of Ras-like GTPase activity (Roadblock/LC7/MglB family)